MGSTTVKGRKWKVWRSYEGGGIWFLRESKGVVYGFSMKKAVWGVEYHLKCRDVAQTTDVRNRVLTGDREYALIELERMGRVYG